MVAPMGVKFGVEEGTLQGEKPQNRPLSKLNTGRFALRAMLPVKIRRVAEETTTCSSRVVGTVHCKPGEVYVNRCSVSCQ